MMNNTDDINIELEERIERIEEHVTVLKEMIVQFTEGKWDGNIDNLILEGKVEDYSNAILVRAMRLMEHLLKIAFGTLQDPKNKWTVSAEHHQNKLNDNIMLSGKSKTNTMNLVEKRLEETYNKSIEEYKRSAKIYPDLQPNMKRIPNSIPIQWNIEQLRNESIENLVSAILEGNK